MAGKSGRGDPASTTDRRGSYPVIWDMALQRRVPSDCLKLDVAREVYGGLPKGATHRLTSTGGSVGHKGGDSTSDGLVLMGVPVQNSVDSDNYGAVYK